MEMFGRGTLGFLLGVVATLVLVAVAKLLAQEASEVIVEEDERWPMAKVQKLARDKKMASVVSSLTEPYRSEGSALSSATLDQQIAARSPTAIRATMLLVSGGKANKNDNALADFVRKHDAAAATWRIGEEGLTPCASQCESTSGVFRRKPHPGACRALCTVAVDPYHAMMGANARVMGSVLIAVFFSVAALIAKIIPRHNPPRAINDDEALPAALQQISRLKLQSLVRIRKRLSLQEEYSALHDSGAWRIFEEMQRKGEGDRRERGFQLLRFATSHRERKITASALAKWKFTTNMMAIVGNTARLSDCNNCGSSNCSNITNGDHTISDSRSNSSSTPVAMGGPSYRTRGTLEDSSSSKNSSGADRDKQKRFIVDGG